MIKNWKDVSAEKYHQLMDLSGDTQKIFKIIFEQDLNSLPLSVINSGELDWIKETPATVDIRFITIDGVKMGLVSFDDLSMGEYIDLSMYGEDWKTNIWNIMALCYRPVVGNTLRLKWQEFKGKVLAVAGAILKRRDLTEKAAYMIANMDYTIEKYDPKKHLLNANKFKGVNSEFYNSFLLFFSALSILRMENTLKSLIQEIRPKKKRSPKKG